MSKGIKEIGIQLKSPQQLQRSAPTRGITPSVLL